MSVITIIIYPAAAVEVIMATVVFLSDKKNKIIRLFVTVTIVTAYWIVTNAITTLTPNDFWLRNSYAAGIFVSPVILVWILSFISKKVIDSVKIFIILTPAVAFSFLTYSSNLIIKSVQTSFVGGFNGTFGSLFPLFSFYSLAVIAYSLFLITRAFRNSAGLEKIQYGYIAFGLYGFAFVAAAVSFVLPLFEIESLIPLDSPSSVFFIVAMSYAILKHHLFNIKVIATELLVFSLWLTVLIRTVISESTSDLVINGFLLSLLVIIGIFLIKSVIKEVELRERVEALAKDLEETNERQEKLIHFVGHEVKGYLTKGEYAFSEMLDGDFGKLAPETQGLATTALAELRKGVASVTDILKAANLKRGTVTYEMKPIDLKGLVQEEIERAKVPARDKGLGFGVEIDEAENYMVSADKGQIAEHVVRNLLDNAIKYSPTGTITVSLRRTSKNSTTPTTPLQTQDYKDVILFSVKDSGVGITDEDKKRLFTEGGRGKESLKVNVHSTGYGLYIAKGIVEAHKGRIWAESDGAGKGSTFFVELPGV